MAGRTTVVNKVDQLNIVLSFVVVVVVVVGCRLFDKSCSRCGGIPAGSLVLFTLY